MKKEKKDIDIIIWEKIKTILDWWKRMYAINDDDGYFSIAIKVGIRLVGIVVLLALSPFAILGIMIAFMFVG